VSDALVADVTIWRSELLRYDNPLLPADADLVSVRVRDRVRVS